VKKQIDASAAKAGRSAKDITLVAVTKNQPNEKIAELISLGQHHFAENKVQELEKKAEHFKDQHWHMIGHLQTNKAKNAVKYAEYIHSVDSEKIARKIDEIAAKMGKRQKIFAEVNIAKIKGRFGCEPNKTADLVEKIEEMENIELLGLMGMAPFVSEQETRPYFKNLAKIAKELGLKHLSMGMSNDFSAAIAEGATFVRIGTALFEDKK
jgi:pyridoxal phosphate enzyme (YggS family)